MAPRLIAIDNADDPEIAEFRDIRERDLTGRHNRFIAEGTVVLRMLAEASFAGPGGGGAAVQIPPSAVQQVADRSVVYVVNPAHDLEFLERSVQLGEVAGNSVAVVAGLERDSVRPSSR